MKVWEGPSKHDGKTVFVCLSSLHTKSTNTKTADMVNANMLVKDTKPNAAAKTGEDESVCGGCILKPLVWKQNTDPDKPKEPCYIRLMHFPLATWKKNHDQPVQVIDEIPKPLRIGGYGDPAMVPVWVWQYLTKLAKKWTGYTHDGWKRDANAYTPELKHLVMASCETPAQARQAQSQGWRTFRTRGKDDPILPNEISCPASAEAGKRTNCRTCLLCDGKTGPNDKRKNITIISH
jgi:hypothetical protein